MSYVIAVVVIAIGVILIAKTEWFLSNFGSIAWAEQHLGTEGGSRLMYKLIGLAAIILALMGVTGLLGEVVLSIFGNLFPRPA